jgi:threonine/homoserine/homoserine lactone efflux protein
MDPWLLSLVGFAVAGSVTPGPNNIMVAAIAARHGVRASVPYMLGISAGFGVMIVLVGTGFAGMIAGAPTFAATMRWAALAWILVLAWQIATAPPPGEGPARPAMGFFGATLFQWVNPKAWLLALSVAAAWVSPDRPALPQVAVIALAFALVGPPCNLPWALLGTGAARLLRSPARLRAFNVAMAVLLVASMLPVAFGL